MIRKVNPPTPTMQTLRSRMLLPLLLHLRGERCNGNILEKKNQPVHQASANTLSQSNPARTNPQKCATLHQSCFLKSGTQVHSEKKHRGLVNQQMHCATVACRRTRCLSFSSLSRCLVQVVIPRQTNCCMGQDLRMYSPLPLTPILILCFFFLKKKSISLPYISPLLTFCPISQLKATALSLPRI